MALPLRLLAVSLIFAPIAVLSACSSGAPRRDPNDPPISFKQFEAADANHDGKLSMEEARTIPEMAEGVRGTVQMSFETLFKRLDTDHSGLLSWSEMRETRFPIFPIPRMQLKEGPAQ